MKLDSSIIVRGFVEEIRETESWKRLQDKTQVFDERVSREIKTRGSHSVDVAMIAENLCMKLGADEITQAKAYLVGILHDLGHIAYGHAGESVAQDYLEHYDFTQEERDRIFELRKLIFGEKYALANNDKITFEHNENSVLAYLTLCKECGYVPDENIIIGIISHSTSRYENLPPLLFQQAVRLADKIAYINYDIQDLFTSFKNKPDELSALNKMYEEKPLKDPDDNEITIKMPDGRNMTFIEFVRLSADEKINLFIMEAVRDAKVQKANPENKYRELETVLTVCNDLVVKISDFRKKIRKAVTEEDKEKLEQELKALNKKLYERSPLLYAFYEVKNRSDEYIRTGKGE